MTQHRASRRVDVTNAPPDIQSAEGSLDLEDQDLGDGPEDGTPSVEATPVLTEGRSTTKVIHFVEDGLTALGKVWYRGQELRVEQGTKEWEQVHSQDGTSWMDHDKWQQQERYGRQMFDEGPWRGNDYDLDDPNLDENQRAELARKLGKSNGPGITLKKR